MLDLTKLDEILEKTARKKKQAENNIKDKTVLKFVKKYNIQKGERKTPNYIIFYYYYKVWSGTVKEKKHHKPQFFRLFGKSFTAFRDNFRGFRLNDTLEINSTIKLEAKVFDYQYRLSRNKKRQAKVREHKENENKTQS